MARKVIAVVLPLLLLCASVLGILLLCIPTKDIKDTPNFKYGIVLDAGSSHTSLFIYKWPADKENDTGIVSEHQKCEVHGGGISSYADNPPDAGKSLELCLSEAVKHVPSERHKLTPIYLGATAGMRLLNLSNPASSNDVLEAVSSTLQSYPFDFRGAKILSGQDEGVFGWVTANYLLENFVKYGWIGRWTRPAKGTLGAMDFGGASTQITFATNAGIEDKENEVNLRLYGQSYKVYTHSFLCYGRDQVLRRMLSKVLKANDYNSSLLNPCWPNGYSKTISLGKNVYDSPCTADEKPNPFDPNTRITMSGTGLPGECRIYVDSLFNFGDCKFASCSFDGVFQPEVTGNFIAFSAFFYTVDFIRTVMEMPVNSIADLNATSEEICSTDWSKLKAKAPHLESLLPDYCTSAIFVYVLTVNGYKFDNRTFPNIKFEKKAGDTSIGWALGYMLNLTNMIPAEDLGVRKGTDYNSWVVLILLFVAIMLSALVMLFCLFRSGKDQTI
ncbi:ectonucleoside triphosphate diphosphohydrolase 2 isoform X1 [Pleurodeles waltl]|uniref:ectonucleoside triphosphate diphosphohydrolase 2 isoform X1 n=1 Tax=Pleurodeles waltl TaxID=8319 RepID=UPI0037094130